MTVMRRKPTGAEATGTLSGRRARPRDPDRGPSATGSPASSPRRRSPARRPATTNDGQRSDDGGRRTANGSVTSSARRGEPVQRRRPATRAARRRHLPRRLQHPAAQQHPLQVRRRHLVAQRGHVDVPQLRDRERPAGPARTRCSCTTAWPAAGQRRPDDRAVVERGLRQRVDGVPGGVLGQHRVEVRRDQPEVGGGDRPPAGIAARVAAGLQLLQVRELLHLHLAGQLPGDRGPQGLVGAAAARRAAPRPRRTARSPAARASRAAAPARTWRTDGQRLVRVGGPSGDDQTDVTPGMVWSDRRGFRLIGRNPLVGGRR